LGSRRAGLTLKKRQRFGAKGWPLWPLLSLCPCGSGRSYRASVAGQARGARFALRPFWSGRTILAARTNRSCRTLRPWRSVRTIFTARPNWTGSTRRTRGTSGPLLIPRELRVHWREAGLGRARRRRNRRVYSIERATGGDKTGVNSGGYALRAGRCRECKSGCAGSERTRGVAE
jgi:hypothetical protein